MESRKNIFITGCSQGGIGAALARAFHNRGHRVIASARDPAKTGGLQALGIDVIALDICDATSIEEAFEKVRHMVSTRLDVLVNNAGIGYAMPFLDTKLIAAKKLFETNFFGRIAVTQTFAPLLIQSKGTIVNIGSISGVCPTPYTSIYNASCAAVHQWSDTLRLELAPFDVKVVLVITGAVKSQFLSNLPAKHLPENSLYLPERQVIEGGMMGKEVGGDSTDTQVYAERVVANVLGSRQRKHRWVGILTTRLRMASTFLWSTAWEMILADRFGLVALKKKVAADGSYMEGKGTD